MSKLYVVPSRIQGFDVRITYSTLSDGRRILYGRLYARRNQTFYGKRREYRYDPDKIGEETAIRTIVRRVEDAYEAAASPDKRPARRGPSAQKGIFSQAFEEFKAHDQPKLTWGPSTVHTTYTYAEKNVLSYLDKLGYDVSSADMAELKKSLIQKAAKNKRGHRNEAVAENSVSGYLQRINWVLERLHQRDSTLPLIQFEIDNTLAVPTFEQAKFIPDSVRVKLAYILLSLADNSMSFGVAAMLLMGLRPAETCAIQIGSMMIREEDDYVDCPVIAQIKNGKRTDILKTEAAYRHAIGGVFMVHFIKRKCQQLRDLGYTEEELAAMPFVSSQLDPAQYADPSALSAYAKTLLLKCGYKEEYLNTAYTLMDQEPDLGGHNGKEQDVVAYILRRDWVGRAANCCGMSAVDIDYLIGHANRKKCVTDYTNPDVQRTLARQLERYVFLPDCSRHPSFAPISAKPGRKKKVSLDDYSAYRICAESGPLEIKFVYNTTEANESICIRTNGKFLTKVESDSGEIDTPMKRKARLPVGVVHPHSYYQRLIEQAKQIDLTNI